MITLDTFFKLYARVGDVQALIGETLVLTNAEMLAAGVAPIAIRLDELPLAGSPRISGYVLAGPHDLIGRLVCGISTSAYLLNPTTVGDLRFLTALPLTLAWARKAGKLSHISSFAPLDTAAEMAIIRSVD